MVIVETMERWTTKVFAEISFLSFFGSVGFEKARFTFVKIAVLVSSARAMATAYGENKKKKGFLCFNKKIFLRRNPFHNVVGHLE